MSRTFSTSDSIKSAVPPNGRHPWSNLLLRRRDIGATIPEFQSALFLALFCIIVPASNLVLLFVACMTLNHAFKEHVNQIGMAESRSDAVRRSAECSHIFRNPVQTLGHKVETTNRTSTPVLQIGVEDSRTRKRRFFQATRPLPTEFTPEANSKVDKQKSYYYSLTIPCRIYPLLNLSGLPVIGQLPAIGAPVELNLHGEVAVEYLPSLQR